MAKKKSEKKAERAREAQPEPKEQPQQPQPPPWTYIAYGSFVVLAAMLVYYFVTVARDGEMRRECAAFCLTRPNYAGANLTAPDFKLKDMNGQEVALSSYRGKVVILNFWASWCAPCREEMPDLGELAHILKPQKDVVLLTVSVDSGPDEVRDLLKTVLREDPPPFPVLFDPNATTFVGPKYGTRQYPETWLIDKHGVIRARFDGARPWSNAIYVEAIDQLRNDYCPVEIKEGNTTGKAARFCEDPTGT